MLTHNYTNVCPKCGSGRTFTITNTDTNTGKIHHIIQCVSCSYRGEGSTEQKAYDAYMNIIFEDNYKAPITYDLPHIDTHVNKQEMLAILDRINHYLEEELE